MKILSAFWLLLLSGAFVCGQRTFDLKNASQYFDIKATVAKCENGLCGGAASFAFYRKNSAAPYQVIELPNTQIWLDGNGDAQTNNTLLYDEQSVVNIDDFNFDGMEDVAICDGGNGSYGMPSYRVYLSSRAAKKFVYSPAFSRLGQHLGMFKVDPKTKTLITLDKSGCCWHIMEEYSVAGNRPVKIFSETTDATIPDESKVKVTTKKLVAGKWQTKITYIKRDPN